MKYRDILGFSKSKKKVIKEQSKPKKTVLDGIKEDLLKESYVWERQFGEKLPTLADVQKAKKLNEVGASAEYRPHIKKINNLYHDYWDAVKDFTDLLHDKGVKKEANNLHRLFMKTTHKFNGFFVKMIRKLM